MATEQTPKHDFVTDLANIIRPLANFEYAYSQRIGGVELVRIDERYSSALWRFDDTEGFIYCGDALARVEAEQDDAWFKIEDDIGEALFLAGRSKAECWCHAQEGGFEQAKYDCETERLGCESDLSWEREQSELEGLPYGW